MGARAGTGSTHSILCVYLAMVTVEWALVVSGVQMRLQIYEFTVTARVAIYFGILDFNPLTPNDL
jgi:predicted DNA-binding transcriptional regulator